MAYSSVRYIDKTGIPRLVLLDDPAAPPEEGIPLSVDLSTLYGHMPIEFQRDLYDSLWAQGLVTEMDYAKPGAADRFKAAMLSVIKHDFLDVQKLIKGV